MTSPTYVALQSLAEINYFADCIVTYCSPFLWTVDALISASIMRMLRHLTPSFLTKFGETLVAAGEAVKCAGRNGDSLNSLIKRGLERAPVRILTWARDLIQAGLEKIQKKDGPNKD